MLNVVELVKQAAQEAVQAGKPTEFRYGTVSKASPLEIKVDQKVTLKAEMLVLTRNVTDFEMQTEGGGHIDVRNALKVGDRVIMLREQGGKKFVVIDRVG